MLSICHYFFAVTALLIIGASEYALADSSKSAGIEEKAIEQLTVTADRRPSALRSTMPSLDRFASEELKTIDADHIAELLNQSAGVAFHRGSGVEYLGAIRSPVFSGGAGAGSFLLLEDGISTRSSGFANVNGLSETFFEAAGAVEVIKGPGSALYGSNAVHGTVNVISPSLREATNNLRISTGSHGFTQLYGNAQTNTETSSYRADAFVARDDGYRESSGFDQQKIKLQHLQNLKNGDVHTVLDLFNLNQNTAGFLQGDDAYRDKALAKTSNFPDAYRNWRSLRLHQRWSIATSNDHQWIITPYLRANDMEFLQHFLPTQPLEKNGHDSLGLQTALYQQFENHSLVMGADIEATQGYLTVFQDQPTGGFGTPYPQGIHYDYDVNAYNASIFLQDSFVIAKNSIELGLRAEYVRYDYTNNADDFFDPSIRIQRISDRRNEYLQVTPKLSIARQLNEQSTVVLKILRGERAPQTSDLYRVQVNQEGGAARVETLDSIEIAYEQKREKTRLNASAFYMEKDNFFFRDRNGENVVDGETSHIGIEINLDWTLSQFWRTQLTATYAKHQYRFSRVGGNESISSGDDIDSAPRELANLGIHYEKRQFKQALEVRYVGAYFTDAANENDYPGHVVFVWRSSVQLSDKARLFWRVNNLTDRRYAERADFAFGNERYFPGEGRTAFFGIDYQTH